MNRTAAGLAALLLLLGQPASPCTIFVAARGGRVLAGNNEDWTNPRTYVWFEPGSDSRHGAVYFGFDDHFPQGGMNERGLFFDAAALPVREPAAAPGKKRADGGILARMMRECATVEEALTLLAKYDLTGLEAAQLLVADRTGASAIVERNHVHRRSGDYQVVTNFRHSRVPPKRATCERFRAASRLFGVDASISIDLFRSILEATRQAGPSSTQYSNIYDLRAGEVYVYHARDFARVVKLHLQTELAKGKRRIPIASLFSNADPGAKRGGTTSLDDTPRPLGSRAGVIVRRCQSRRFPAATPHFGRSGRAEPSGPAFRRPLRPPHVLRRSGRVG